MEISEITYESLKNMLAGAAALVIKNRDELGRLDAAIGDGDHGVTMERAMNIVISKMSEDTSGDMSTMLADIAWALMDCDGGATGPLYGSLFLGFSDATMDKSSLNCKGLAEMVDGGLKSIMEQTKAKVGDKTMMDALIPAVEALKKTADADKTIVEALTEAYKAAKEGSDYTSTIPAHFGRAKYQLERTIGHPDPGSVSITLVFKGFLQGLGVTD